MNYPCIQEVILTQTARGEGTEEGPTRTVLQVYSRDGELIAEHDPSGEVALQEDERSTLRRGVLAAVRASTARHWPAIISDAGTAEIRQRLFGILDALNY